MSARTQRSLRILQVSTAEVRGGAEQVASNLFRAYRAHGHDAWLAVGEKHGDDPDVRLLANDRNRNVWSRFWRRAAEGLTPAATASRAAAVVERLAGAVAEPGRLLNYYRGREDFDYPATRRLLALAGERPDVVHAHNLHGGYFDLRRLPSLSAEVPLVLTLHDAWMLSGHCAHSLDCERWRTGCGRCPDLLIYPSVRRDATAYNWRRKRAIVARSRFHLATPSRWLMQKVEASMLAPSIREARVIPNGVDLSLFRPGDRRAARAALGLPSDAPVVVTTGVDLERNRWKDLPTLLAALERVSDRWTGPRIHAVALGTAGQNGPVGRAAIQFVPYERDPATVARYYQAADVYVHAARADTFPVAVLEALACGTPVVASDVGGIPEQVDDGGSGFLVPPADASALDARLDLVLRDDELRARLGRHAAERASQEFDFERQVRRYLGWYAEILTLDRRPVR